MKPLDLAVIGAGTRGTVYAGYCDAHPEQARVVAVAEPFDERRARFCARHGVPEEGSFSSWEELLDRPRDIDAVIIASPDRLHVPQALRALDLGYEILLEKPIAPTQDEILQLAEAAARVSGKITIAHVLRYTPFFSRIKKLLDAGRIGHLVSVQWAENIGYWHFAHSYVRGNWGNSTRSSPMILAKSCHDMDMLRWLVDSPWSRISSFGELRLFRPEEAPEGAPERCIDGCPIYETCPFNAVTFYVDSFANHTGWPVAMLSEDTSRDSLLEAVRHGPYGRCVYRCDNDVADHQVATVSFSNGVSATLSVSATTAEITRTLKLMGSEGEIRGHLDKGEIEVRTFGPLRGGRRPADDGGVTIPVGFSSEVTTALTGVGHSGGDEGLMRAFIARASGEDAGAGAAASTSLAESLDSHLMAFAAEESRREGRVVTANPYSVPKLPGSGAQVGAPD